MSEQTWVSPLQFKIVGNFLEIMNKENTFRFNDMVEGNPRNSYLFVPVSRCSDIWYNNIKSDYTLNYDVVTPLQYKVDGEEASPLELEGVHLLAEDTESKGIVVSVLEQTPAILLGDVVQEFKGCFIVNEVTGAVIAYCILPETVDISEYIIFSYQGYLLEINNDVKVLDLELPLVEEDEHNIVAEHLELQSFTYSSGHTHFNLEPSLISSTIDSPFMITGKFKSDTDGFGIVMSQPNLQYVRNNNQGFIDNSQRTDTVVSLGEWHTFELVYNGVDATISVDNVLLNTIHYPTYPVAIQMVAIALNEGVVVEFKDIVIEKLEV